MEKWRKKKQKKKKEVSIFYWEDVFLYWKSASLYDWDSGDWAVRLPGLVQVPTIIRGSVAKDLSGLTFFLSKMALTKSPSERLNMLKYKSS